MLKVFLTILAYCALTILAAPPNLQDQLTNVSSDAINLSQGRPHSLDGGTCIWDDTLGDADWQVIARILSSVFYLTDRGTSGTFTVTFGDGSIWGFKAYTTVRLPNFSTNFILNCSNHGDTWTAVTDTPGLPYIISIHGGNGCISTDIRWEDWDNLWIKYANQWVNVPTDERCSNVFWNGKGRRCVIEIKPADPIPKSDDEVVGATVRGEGN